MCTDDVDSFSGNINKLERTELATLCLDIGVEPYSPFALQPHSSPVYICYSLCEEALVAATKEIGLEVNAHKTKYMVMSGDQNTGRIHSVRIDSSTFERVEEFKYLGTTLTNQNSIAEEIKSRLK